MKDDEKKMEDQREKEEEKKLNAQAQSIISFIFIRHFFPNFVSSFLYCYFLLALLLY